MLTPLLGTIRYHHFWVRFANTAGSKPPTRQQTTHMGSPSTWVLHWAPMRPHGCPWGPHGIPQVGERRGRGGGRGGGGGWGRGGRGAGGKGRMGEVRLRVCAWALLGSLGLSLAFLGLAGPTWPLTGSPWLFLAFRGSQTIAVTTARQPPSQWPDNRRDNVRDNRRTWP